MRKFTLIGILLFLIFFTACKKEFPPKSMQKAMRLQGLESIMQIVRMV